MKRFVSNCNIRRYVGAFNSLGAGASGSFVDDVLIIVAN